MGLSHETTHESVNDPGLASTRRTRDQRVDQVHDHFRTILEDSDLHSKIGIWCEVLFIRNDRVFVRISEHETNLREAARLSIFVLDTRRVSTGIECRFEPTKPKRREILCHPGMTQPNRERHGVRIEVDREKLTSCRRTSPNELIPIVHSHPRTIGALPTNLLTQSRMERHSNGSPNPPMPEPWIRKRIRSENENQEPFKRRLVILTPDRSHERPHSTDHE